jgi:hypothetical protein
MAAFLQPCRVVETSAWTDWLTESVFRVRASPAAAEKLNQLPPEKQQRLRQMLQEIAQLADLAPANTSAAWESSGARQLLSLELGRVCVRYSISEDTRTLAIEHVILLPDEGLERTG